MNWRKKECRSRERCDCLERMPSLVRDPVEGPDAAFLAVDQSGLAQQFQMVTDRRLILVELVGDVADTQRLPLLREQVEHAQACGIGEYLQAPGERDRLRKRQAGCGRRGAAGIIFVPDPQRPEMGLSLRLCSRSHSHIITDPLMDVNGF